MIAALLTETNKPLVLRDIAKARLQPGQAFVRILASGICGAQLQEIRGEKGTHFPRLLGHEGCGIVEEIGPGVTKLKPGQKVVMHWRKGEGMESESPRYVVDGNTITSGQVTTFSEASVCSENRLTPVPHDTSPLLCSLLGCGLSTAIGVMENDAKLKMGETVLVVGCGGVGLNMIRVARMMGASRIVGTDKFNKRNETILAGASEVYCFYGIPCAEVFDVIVDTTGDPEAFSRAAPMLASGGRYVLVGQPKPGTDLVLSSARHLFDGEGKRIIGSQGGQFNPTRDIPRIVQAHHAGFLNIDHLVTHEFSFGRINEAIETVRSGGAGRVILKMQ